MSLSFHENPSFSQFIETITDKEIMNKLGTMIKGGSSSTSIRVKKIKGNAPEYKCFRFDEKIMKDLSEKMRTHDAHAVKKFLGSCLRNGSLHIEEETKSNPARSSMKESKCTQAVSHLFQDKEKVVHTTESEKHIEHAAHADHEEHIDHDEHVKEKEHTAGHESHMSSHHTAIEEHDELHAGDIQEGENKHKHLSVDRSDKNKKEESKEREEIEKIHREEAKNFELLEEEEQKAADERRDAERSVEKRDREIRTTENLYENSNKEDLEVDLHAAHLVTADKESDYAVHDLQNKNALSDQVLHEKTIDQIAYRTLRCMNDKKVEETTKKRTK